MYVSYKCKENLWISSSGFYNEITRSAIDIRYNRIITTLIRKTRLTDKYMSRIRLAFPTASSFSRQDRQGSWDNRIQHRRGIKRVPFSIETFPKTTSEDDY